MGGSFRLRHGTDHLWINTIGNKPALYVAQYYRHIDCNLSIWNHSLCSCKPSKFGGEAVVWAVSETKPA